MNWYLDRVAGRKNTRLVCIDEKNKSPLPLKDPRDAEAQRMLLLNIPYRIIW